MKTIVILTHVTFDDSPYCSYVHNHAKALAEQGYNVVVFAIIHWLPILSNFQRYKKQFMQKMKNSKKIQIIDNVKVIYKKAFSFSNLLYKTTINLNGLFYYISIKRLFKKLAKENEIVLVDAHTFKVEGYVAYKLKKKYPNITATLTLHGTSFNRNYKTINGRKQIKKYLRYIDYAICVSNKIERQLQELNINNKKVIFNGIEHHKIAKVQKQKYNIVSVGTLNKGKNFDIIIQVINELKNNYSDIHLKIIGDGPEKGNLMRIVKENQLENNVEFLGKMQNNQVMEIMNESYIFLLPSSPEGFGIVYPEAMYNHCITIGTKGEGIDGFIKHGENGFLVNVNEKEIAILIENIYSNSYEVEKIKENAYEAACSLTWSKNAQEYISLIE